MMLCFLFATLIVALDQFFKQYILRTIELGEIGPELIPGVIGLTHWENDGAMLNFLSGQQWLLAAIALIVSVALVMILLRYNEGFWGTLALSSVLGGTVGNLLDRIFNEGKVIDMFRTLFINFPIFNIADIFITLGFITFLIHFVVLTFKAEAGETPAVSEDIDSFETFDVPARPDTLSQIVSDIDISADAGSNDPISEIIPDVSFSLESIEAELESLDVDDILREYGLENNNNNK